MDFGTSVKTCFNKYAVFAGRASRSEFWWFALFTTAASQVLSFIDVTIFDGVSQDLSPLNSLFVLATLLPSLGVAVRRLHDTDRSGWWWWLVLLPIIGWIILIVWYATQGTNGRNSFGFDPLANDDDAGSPPLAEEVEQYSHSSIPRVSKH